MTWFYVIGALILYAVLGRFTIGFMITISPTSPTSIDRGFQVFVACLWPFLWLVILIAAIAGACWIALSWVYRRIKILHKVLKWAESMGSKLAKEVGEHLD